MSELCAPWVDSLDLCDVEDPDPEMVTLALSVATEILFHATARKFRGVCTDTITPCGSGCGPQWLAYPDGSSRPLPLSADGCFCRDVPMRGGEMIVCDGRVYPAIRLPNTPVVDVTETVLDGQPIATLIVDDRWIIRDNGTAWPCCTHLTEPADWHVTYRWGSPVPGSAKVAVQVLACEFLKGWTGGACRIPKRVTQIAREGVTMTLLDTFDDLIRQGFGIAEVAGFVQTFNPNGLQEPAKLVAPGLMRNRPRRVR